MLTKNRSTPARRSLTLENLESRLNLSTLGTSIVPHSTLVGVARSGHSRTYTSIKPVALKLASTATAKTSLSTVITPTNTSDDPYTSLTFGDTTVASSGTTAIDINSPSTISGAAVEWNNGVSDVGQVSTGGADIEYKVNASASGTYALNFNYSVPGAWASWDVYVNGSKQVSYALLNTNGSYQNSSQNITLASGANVIKIVPTWGSQMTFRGLSLTAVNVNAATTTTTGTGTAVSGTAATTIGAASYSASSGASLESSGGVSDMNLSSASGTSASYTVNASASGTYNLTLNTAVAGAWASWDVYVNGSKQASYAILGTGGSQTYSNTSQGITLSAGSNVIQIVPTWGSQLNLRSLTTTPVNVTATSPTTTTTTTTSNTSATTSLSSSSSTSVPVNSYSAASGVTIDSGYGDASYSSANGTYASYTVNAASAGTYTLNLSDAVSGSWASWDVYVNGSKQASYAVLGTGGSQTYSSTSQGISLSAGSNVIKIVPTWGSSMNIKAMTLTPAGAAATTTTTATTTTPATTTNTSTSTTTTTTTPVTTGSNDVSVSTTWMTSFNQLNIVAGSGNDTITVTQSGGTIYVNCNGVTNAYTGSYGDIVVKAGSGSDNITVDSSVSVDTLVYGGSGNDTLKNLTRGNATIVSVGGGYDSVQGNGSNTAYWVDSTDGVTSSSTEQANGDVHKVSSFWGGVSTTLAGQDLSDPAGTGATTRLTNASLWGTGATVSDINQGQVADCFFLGALQTLAYTNTGKLRQMAVDLGDGTYAVQFTRNGTTSYVRVDGDLPSNGYYANGLMYAHPGASGDIWAEVMEKAYAEFRTSGWNYSSLSEGYFGSVFSDLGVNYSTLSSSTSTLYSAITSALANGKGITIGTYNGVNAGAPLVGDHTYTVTAAYTSGGVQYVTLRNPWGYDGAGNDGNSGDALVTMTISQLSANMQMGTILA